MSCVPIQRAVCNHFGVTPEQLIAKDRHKSIAFARHMAMHLCRSILGLSYPELGRAFGWRDHTTVMNGCRKMELTLATDPKAAAHRDAIVKALAPEPVRQQAPAPDYSIREAS
jgi:chromosomal replication initiator protein